MLHSFLTSALNGSKLSHSRPGRFISWKRAVRYAVVQWLGGNQNRSGRFTEENDHLLLLGVEQLFLGLSVHSLLAVPTAVSQLLYLHEGDIDACYWQPVS